MKKVLSLVLVLTMVLGSFGMAFAATPAASKFSDVNGLNCEEAVKVLTDLAIVNGYEDGTYKPAGIVTRAEMAVLVVNALGLQNYVTANAKSSFKDMAGYGWAEGYVAYAQSLGVISGYGDGTFKPGKTVSYDEAATMLVAALGYTPVSLQGTWPANYVTKAQSLGILDDIKAGPNGANRGDVAVMLYQTIDQNIGTVDKDNKWEANLGKIVTKDGKKVDLGDKMIYRLGADDFTIAVVTGDEDSDLNLTPYKGAYATKYTKDKKVIAIGDIESEFIKGNFKKNDTATFEGDDDVDYTVKYVKDVYVFKNGEYDSSLTSGAINDDDATVSTDVSGKNINEVYAWMVWEENDAAQVDKDDVAAIKDDKELLNQDFATLKSGDIDTKSFELLGVASLDKIAEDNIVAVYTKKNNGDITRVEVGTEVVKGEVTKVKGTDADKDVKYTIDGKEYKASTLKGSDYTNNAANILSVGDEVTAYLDYDGKIYTTDTISDSENYAVVTYPVGEDGLKKDYKIELLLADDTTKVFGFKDSADGAAAEADKVNITYGALVKYDVNKSGDLTELTASALKLAGKELKNNILDGYRVADNCVVFASASSDVDDYAVYKLADVKTEEALNGFYFLNDKQKVAAIVLNDNKYVGANDNYGLISDYGRTQDADGDACLEISAVINGKKVTYLTDGEGMKDEAGLNLKFYQIDMTGEVIDDLNVVTFDAVDSDDISGTKVLMLTGAGVAATTDNMVTTPQAIVTIGAMNAFRVQATDSGRIKVADKYVALDDKAVIYTPTFDSDDSFDEWATISSVSKDSYVVLLQTDSDSDSWDTIICIKKGDIETFLTEFANELK